MHPLCSNHHPMISSNNHHTFFTKKVTSFYSCQDTLLHINSDVSYPKMKRVAFSRYFQRFIGFDIYKNLCETTVESLNNTIQVTEKKKRNQCPSPIIVTVIQVNYQVPSLAAVDILHFFFSCAFSLILQSLNHLF